MTRGRKRKPVETHILNQNPGKRELIIPPEYNTGDMLPPDELLEDKNTIARDEWNRQAPLLKRSKVYKEVDKASFLAYCFAYQNYINAQTGIATYGMLTKNKDGTVSLNPYMKAQKIAFEQMIKVATEFGMTPCSRARVGDFGDPDKGKKALQMKSLEDKIFGDGD